MKARMRQLVVLQLEDEEMRGDEDEADCYAWLGDEE